MDIDFQAFVEQTLNAQNDRIAALENALTQVQGVDFELDPSRPQVVKVAPPPMRPTTMVVPNG